jgi:hypothetical protein
VFRTDRIVAAVGPNSHRVRDSDRSRLGSSSLDDRARGAPESAHRKCPSESEFAAHGAARSFRLSVAVAGHFDTIHKEARAEAMPIALDFAKRMQNRH